MSFSKHASPAGFTLIDLLVSMSIFGVITAMVVVNYRAGGRNDTVRQAANMALATVQRAQNMTLSGALLPNESLAEADRFPRGGYGVYFSASSNDEFILFADTDSTHTYNAGVDTIIETIPMPEDSIFTVPVNLSAVFAPPGASVYFNGSNSGAENLSKQVSFGAPGTEVGKVLTIFRISGQARVE